MIARCYLLICLIVLVSTHNGISDPIKLAVAFLSLFAFMAPLVPIPVVGGK